MIRSLALGLVAVVFAAGTALAAKPMHRHMTHSSHATRAHATHSGAPADADHSADQLNAQSLQRTQSGQ